MKTLVLNHAAIHTKWTRAHFLLVSGLLCLSFSVIQARQINDEVDQLNAELQSLNHRKKQVSRPIRVKEIDSQDKALTLAVEEILLPWNSMFKALETANHEGIQMLSIEPNAKSRLVRIRAVALDTESMMRYLSNLDAQKSLRNVVLVSHEVVEMNGQSAIELVAEAVWNV
jgi:seryl-tRNA synthetase